MNKSKKNIDYSADEAWKILIDKYDIINKIKKDGLFYIEARQVKEYKEPRLMSKWDCSQQLPSSFKENNINILPNSRKSYVLGDFLLYEPIPALNENVTQMPFVELPEYETIDVDNITSESNAINVLVLSRILDDFLATDENVVTFNGRMSTGNFDFMVDTASYVKRKIHVNNAQCEIDGGFENNDSVVIIEAKNVIHEDFHVRQLYYPYRLWKKRVKKPIRLVFSVYSNKIYRLFEYKFEDENDYSSIKLVQSKNYSLQDTSITMDELIDLYKETTVIYDDNMINKELPPFIQADNFERVISLLENMNENPMNDQEIADLMQFGCNLSNGKPVYRQSQYYYNAGRYLGLFTKEYDYGKRTVSCLTSLGKKVYKMHYKERQLKLVALILEHKIFNELFNYVIVKGDFPSKEYIKKRMIELNVCQSGQIDRRSNSVKAWLYWIFNLTKL